MIAPRFAPLILRQVLRNGTRTLLTVGGTAVAIFLFTFLQALQGAVRRATEESSRDTRLIVYRENRYCPFTSRLPEHYRERIAALPHVAEVMPVKIVVNNCRTSLDVVTFRGIPARQFHAGDGRDLRLLAGSFEEWLRRSDAALLGEALATRRGLKPGDRFDAAGVTVYVAGIISSERDQDLNVGYVHLGFLQQTVDRRLGAVTQFAVRVTDPARLDEVAAAIDAEFRADTDPTATSAEQAFIARATRDIVTMASFTRWLGYGCILAVFALVANAIVLSVQERVKEHAVLRTLGFPDGLIARLILGEGMLLGLAGGGAGALASLAALHRGALSLTSEGVSISMRADPFVFAQGVAVAMTIGALAGLAPALRASRREIAGSFRTA